MEHWLPLFYPSRATLFDYLPKNSLVAIDHLGRESRDERLAMIRDAYEARTQTDRKLHYHPLEPTRLYLDEEEWREALAVRPTRRFSAFQEAEGEVALDMGARQGRNFSAERKLDSVNLFEATADHAKALAAGGKRVLFASWSDGSSDRLGSMLADHGLKNIPLAPYWDAAKAADPKTPQRVVLPLEYGFETDTLAVISETDILGDRLARPKRRRRASNFLAEASSLTPGDLVVHIDHGIGRYDGLKTLDVQGAPHDTLELQYGGEAKLYLPVENIDLLTRYGSDGEGVQLDRLGGAAWQARKARAKERLREMADGLIRIAAERAMKQTEEIEPPHGVFDEFCARFPYDETDDQLAAIADVLQDLGSGKPMDRLICGDVGFG
jgi:transcription-repair coupling factor (superfamily II helicase)